MGGACPTVFDPTQAPAGSHTAFMWEKLPYRLHGHPDNWDRAGEEHGKVMLALWRRHAPNLEDAVIDWFTRSPRDVARSLPNMRDGDLPHRRLHQRPGRVPPAVLRGGLYRTHIPGLYLADPAATPAETSPGFPATTRRR